MKTPDRLKKLIIIVLAAMVALSISSCSSVVELEKQAIVSAVGIDKGENARFKVCAQIFQSMGAGSSTPIDSSQTNTIVVSAEGNTVAQCMDQMSVILGRKLNIGHSKYIVLGNDMLSVPLSETLDYFIRSEQTYLGVPVICSSTTARDILDVKLKNEVETAIAVENIIRTAIEDGKALKTDLLSIANSRTAAIPIIRKEEPPQKQSEGGEGGKESEGSESAEEEDIKLLFEGTQIVNDGKIIYTASVEETEGYCWLEGKLERSQIRLREDTDPLNVGIDLVKRTATVKRINGEYVMIYKLRIKAKLVDSLAYASNCGDICGEVEERLEKLCADSFTALSSKPDGDFLGVEKITHSVYPFTSLHDDDIFSSCSVSVNVECTIDK